MASATTAGSCALPPSRFQGDGEGMVDLLVDASVRAKEATREAAKAAGKAPPRAGRDLVPYFAPGSTDWGVEDVNTNTDDSDGPDGSLRGYDSCGSNSSRSSQPRCLPCADRSNNAQPTKGKARKAKLRSPAPPKSQPQAQDQALLTEAAAYAGTARAPPPEALPMPPTWLLRKSRSSPISSPLKPKAPEPKAPKPTVADATSALRAMLQLRESSNISAASDLKKILHVSALAVMV